MDRGNNAVFSADTFSRGFTPGWKVNLDENQSTGAIDSANNAVLSADFKNVIFKMIHWA